MIGWKASTTFLGLIGAVMLLQLPRALRMSRLRRQLYEARTRWPGEDPVRLFFRVVPATPFGGESFVRKVAVARATLAQPMLDARLRVREVLGGLAAYVGVLGVGGAAAMLSLTRFPVAASPPPLRPLHVEEAASLACPAPESPEADPAARPTFAPLGGIAMFPSPEALAAAQAQVVAAIPDSMVRSLGPLLLVWIVSDAPQVDDDDDEAVDDDDEAVEALLKERSERVLAALTAAGARGYALGKATPFVECTAPDEATARAIDDALDEYAFMKRNAMQVAAPWSGAEPTPVQRLARSTFRVAAAAREAARWKLPPRSLWGIVTRAPRVNMGELRAQQARAVEDALANERAAHPIDEEVARLFLAKMAAGAPDKKRIDADLRDRLGVTAGGGVILDRVSRAGSTVQVEFPYLEPYEVDRDVAAMLRWLCARGCAMRILLETR